MRPASAANAEADFAVYEREDDALEDARSRLERELDFGLPLQVIDRSFVPKLRLLNAAAVVVVGPDGLVANTAKYVGETPIVAVNPTQLGLTASCCRFVCIRRGGWSNEFSTVSTACDR